MNKQSCDAKITLALTDGSIYTELGSHEKRSIQCSNGIVESFKKSDDREKTIIKSPLHHQQH